MKINEKKGFTLIELFGALIIISILFVILTPIIINLIEKGKLRTAKISAQKLLEVADEYYSDYLLDSDAYPISVTSNMIDMLSFSGAKPKEATHLRYGVFINSSGSVALAVIYQTTCYSKDFDEKDITTTVITDDTQCVAFPTAAEKLTETVVTTGNGLYELSATKYVYKSDASAAAVLGDTVDDSVQPNNYVVFNNTIWRILNIEDGHIKLISEDINKYYNNYYWEDNSIAWDTWGLRRDDTTYCSTASTQGCNLWVALSTGTYNGVNMTTYPEVLNSSLYNLLNTGAYYTTTLSDDTKAMIEDTPWYYGIYTAGSTDFTDLYLHSTMAKVGLINVKDYIDASTSASCTASGQVACNNWLNGGSYFLTMNAKATDRGYVWSVYDDGSLGTVGARYYSGIRPVVVLNTNVLLEDIGTGTKAAPYQLLYVAE